MVYLLEAQTLAEESSLQLDTDFLYTQAFFMGLVSGVLLEKGKGDSP